MIVKKSNKIKLNKEKGEIKSLIEKHELKIA